MPTCIRVESLKFLLFFVFSCYLCVFFVFFFFFWGGGGCLSGEGLGLRVYKGLGRKPTTSTPRK